MTQTHSRYIQIDDWLFELKSVRAVKVDEYGDPYNAIANCNINGNQMYIDGLLTKNNEEFTKKDFASFYKFCQKMGIDECSYHRFQDGKSVNKAVTVYHDKKGKYAQSSSKIQQLKTQDSDAFENEKRSFHLVK